MEQAEEVSITVGSIPKSVSALESAFHDACNVAYLASQVVENAFCDKALHEKLTGCRDMYVINEDELEAMHFAVYEVHKRIKELRDNYLTALGLEH